MATRNAKASREENLELQDLNLTPEDMSFESEVLNLEPEDFAIMNERNAKIAELAYYKAEQRGFEPGHELEDWYEAEQEVNISQI
jgi:hypothetical protein